MARTAIPTIEAVLTALACAAPDSRISAVEAARELDRLGLLRDSLSRPGLPLRNLLRAGAIHAAYQEDGRWWFIGCPEAARARPPEGRRGSITAPLPDPEAELYEAFREMRESQDRVERQSSRVNGPSASAMEWAARGKRRAMNAIAGLTAESPVRRSARASGPGAADEDAPDWSDAEVAATVADYLAMLMEEQAGRPFDKTAHRRALLPKLDGRTDGAIEFKHRNISTVMERLGLPRIRGYVPARNIQGELIAEVVRQTAGGATLRAAEALAPLPTVVGQAEFVDPPGRTTRVAGRGGKGTLRMPDYGALEAENRRLGRSGEQVVFDMEVARLRAAGQPGLASKVQWVSRDLGDGAGFDIASFESDGSELHIEVKTTRLGATTPFYISAPELDHATAYPAIACIYRVYDLGPRPKVYVVRPPYADALTLEPITYRARR